MITRIGRLTGVSRIVDRSGSSIIDLSCHPPRLANVFESSSSRSKFAFYSAFWNFWNKKDPSNYPRFPAWWCSASGGRERRGSRYTPESVSTPTLGLLEHFLVAGRELPRQSSPGSEDVGLSERPTWKVGLGKFAANCRSRRCSVPFMAKLVEAIVSSDLTRPCTALTTVEAWSDINTILESRNPSFSLSY